MSKKINKGGSCQLPFKTDIANARNYLIKKNYIDKYNNILDYQNLMNNGLKALKNRGKEKYGFEGGRPFVTNDAGTKIFMNKDYFERGQKALFEQVEKNKQKLDPTEFDLPDTSFENRQKDGNWNEVNGEIIPFIVDNSWKEVMEDTTIPQDLKEDFIEEKRLQNYASEQKKSDINERKNRYNSRLTPVDDPITHSFNEVLVWKNNQLALINNDIERAKLSVKNRENLETRNKIKKLENKKALLEEQVTYLSENTLELSMQTIREDLDNIHKAVESEDIHDIEEVRLAIDFYDNFILETFDDEAADEISKLLGTIKKDYKKGLENKIKKFLSEEDLVEETLNNLNTNTTLKRRLNLPDNYEFTLQDLLGNNELTDIGIEDELAFGLSSSQRSDGILPQYLLYSYKKIANKWDNFVFEEHIDKLRAFANQETAENKIDRKDMLEKDEDGVLTGNIITYTAPTWQKSLKNKSNLISNFITSKYSAKKASYNRLMTWYKKNTDPVDFFMLLEVRAKYENNPEYSKYFENISSTESLGYSNELQSLLGDTLYNEMVSNILTKLEKFDNFRIEERFNPNYETLLARQNIWEFYNNYKNNNFSPIGKDKNGLDVYFNYFNDFIVLPKKYKTKSVKNALGEFETTTVETGYYSKEFENMKKDPRKMELWNIYKSMSEFINSTYDIENFGNIKAPMIEDQFQERLLNGFKGGKTNKYGRVGKALSESAHMIKSFYFEKGTNTSDKMRGINKNIQDTSGHKVKELTRAKMLSGMSYEKANQEARKEIYQTYSTDLDQAFEISMKAAASHQTRIEIDPIASLAKDYLSSFHKDRERSLNRVNLWVNKVVKNRSFASRGTEGKGAYEPVEWYDNLKTKNQKRQGIFEVIKNFITGKKFDDKLGVIIPKKIMRLLSEQEKIIVETYDKIANLETLPEFSINDFFDGKYYYFEVQEQIDSKGNKELVYYLDKDPMSRYPYTKEVFMEHLNEYLYHKMNDIGLTLNIAGITDGLLTVNLIVGMGLKPISGLYQRLEGKITNMIRDVEGYYWTPGNLSKASEFLAWTNVLKMSVSKVMTNPENIKKYQQLKIFEQIIERMNVIQQRTDELQKDAEGAGKLLDIFAMAITIPEFKNQGEIVLSMMADIDLVDSDGNPILNEDGDPVKFFDKNNLEFPAFTLINGVLSLKPEFASINLTSNYYQNMTISIGNAIKEIQGNYDNTDVFGAKTKWYGRGFTQYFTWLPEFYNRRLGSVGNEGVNVNLAQRKHKVKGSLLRGADASLSSTALYAGASIGLATGFGGGLLVGVPLTGFLVYKIVKNIASKDAIKNDVNSIMKLANFMESVAIEGVNFPSKLGSAVPILNKLQLKNNSFKNNSLSQKTLGKIFGETDYNSLSQDDIAALKSMSLEMAVMLEALALKLALFALLYDDEDDKVSDRRLFHNFVQNQLSKIINTYNYIGTSPTIVEGFLENGIIRSGKNLWKALNKISEGEFLDGGKAILGSVPVPSDIRNFTAKDLYPWQNNVNFDENPLINELGTLSWIPREMKDFKTDGEKSAAKAWRELRDEERLQIKKDFKDISSNKEILKIIADNVLAEKFVNKKKVAKSKKVNSKDLTYKELLEVQDSEDTDKFKINRSKSKLNLQKKLKSTDLTEYEIEEIIERRFDKY